MAVRGVLGENLRSAGFKPPLAQSQRALLCVTPTAHWLEYADWWNIILTNPLQIENGMAIPQSAAGSGVEWSEQGIASCMA